MEDQVKLKGNTIEEALEKYTKTELYNIITILISRDLDGVNMILDILEQDAWYYITNLKLSHHFKIQKRTFRTFSIYNFIHINQIKEIVTFYNKKFNENFI